MTYQTLNISDTQNIQTLMNFANVVSGGILWPIMLLTVWAIWVLGSVFIGKPIYRAFLFASFFCSIISILFVIMNWLNTGFMYFLFLMTAVGLIWTKLAESYS